MKRSKWRAIRVQVLARQHGICHGCPAAARDVIVPKGAHETAVDQLVAYCRSCRLKHDAPTRIPKGVVTRRIRVWEPAPQLGMRRVTPRRMTVDKDRALDGEVWRGQVKLFADQDPRACVVAACEEGGIRVWTWFDKSHEWVLMLPETGTLTEPTPLRDLVIAEAFRDLHHVVGAARHVNQRRIEHGRDGAAETALHDALARLQVPR